MAKRFAQAQAHYQALRAQAHFQALRAQAHSGGALRIVQSASQISIRPESLPFYLCVFQLKVLLLLTIPKVFN